MTTPGTSEPPPLFPPAGALLVAVLAISWAGPLVRLSSAPAVAVAAWRLILTMGFLVVILGWRRSLFKGVRLRARDWLLAVASGFLLAAHFWTWFASVRYTSIAHAVVLVSTYPFWIAVLSAPFLGERPSGREWAGIGIAVAGTGVIAWGDVGGAGPDAFGFGEGALLGDLLALAAALLVAGYFTIGRGLRQRLDLWGYVALVYGVAAVALAAATFVSPGVAFTGYPTADWLIFLALAAGPMMLGHTGINYAIRYMPAYAANLAILAEAVGATLIAWFLPGIRETPTALTLVGGGLVLVGIGVGTLRRGGKRGLEGRKRAHGARESAAPPETGAPG
ncbi:MAG: DMT family transporter [Gemmatimonadota bacterium]